MRPISDINEGDVYKPLFGFNEWAVLEVNREEKMVKIIMLAGPTYPEHLNRPLWKKNTDKMFTNRVQVGWGKDRASELHTTNSCAATPASAGSGPNGFNK